MISDERLKLPKIYTLEVKSDVYSYPIPSFIQGKFLVKWDLLNLVSKDEAQDEYWEYHISENTIHFNEEFFKLVFNETEWKEKISIVFME